MARFKRLSRSTFMAIVLAVALTLGLAVNVSAQVRPDSLTSKLPNQWVNSFSPPSGPTGPIPINREGAARRGSGDPCMSPNELLTALVPASEIGETMADYPTVFWYMPQTSAPAMEFLIQEANSEEDYYRAEYALAKSSNGAVSTPSLMSLSLPAFANLPPLKIGQEYQWVLSLICNPGDRSNDVVAKGRIVRVQPDPTLARRVRQATPQERVALYANARLWYETVASMVELRRDRPNDNDIANAWVKLLKSVGLETISRKPGV